MLRSYEAQRQHMQVICRSGKDNIRVTSVPPDLQNLIRGCHSFIYLITQNVFIELGVTPRTEDTMTNKTDEAPALIEHEV